MAEIEKKLTCPPDLIVKKLQGTNIKKRVNETFDQKYTFYQAKQSKSLINIHSFYFSLDVAGGCIIIANQNAEFGIIKNRNLVFP